MAELARRYLAECLAVAQAEGANLGGDIVDEIVGGFGRYPADMGTSILADRQAQRPLEWEIRNGVILRKARSHGLPAPISEVVLPLLAAASDGPRLSSGRNERRNPQRRNTVVVESGRIVVEAPHHIEETFRRIGCVQRDLVAAAREHQMPRIGQRLRGLGGPVRRRRGVEASAGQQHWHIAAGRAGYLGRAAGTDHVSQSLSMDGTCAG